MFIRKKYLIISIFILFSLSIGVVCANENITDENPLTDDMSSQDIIETPITEEIESAMDKSPQGSDEIPSKIDAKNVTS